MTVFPDEARMRGDLPIEDNHFATSSFIKENSSFIKA